MGLGRRIRAEVDGEPRSHGQCRDEQDDRQVHGGGDASTRPFGGMALSLVASGVSSVGRLRRRLGRLVRGGLELLGSAEGAPCRGEEDQPRHDEHAEERVQRA